MLLHFALASTSWRHSSDLGCGMGLERVQGNGVRYGILHVCKGEVEIFK